MHRLWWVVLLAGCYNPDPYRACQTVCATDDQCQPGFTCGGNSAGNGRCIPPDFDISRCDVVDARPPLPDAPPNTTCFGSGLLRVCISDEKIPTLGDLDLTSNPSALFDTSVSSPTPCSMVVPQTNGPDVCVYTYRRVIIPLGAYLRGTGDRPLAIVSTLTTTIAGYLDVSSTDLQKGAGTLLASSSLCTTPLPGKNATAALGGGGGAGGSLVTTGGAGGFGSGAIEGGATTNSTTVDAVRGGCSGAAGGQYDSGSGGLGGYGGGAVYLIAGMAMSITGRINASGGGGFAPMARTGGGGGGSGGFIGLDAPAFTVDGNARIYACGGSGSSGGGGNSSAGLAGPTSGPDIDPSGTMGIENSGGGGAGHSAIAGSAANNAVSNTGAGGGGGGGGGGYIGHAGGPFPPVAAPTTRPLAAQM